MKKKTLSGSIFDIFNVLLMIVLSFSFLYPFWNTLILSFNDSLDTMKGGVYFWPRIWTLDNYIAALKDDSIIGAYGITIAKTVLGTATHIILTSSFAYGLSKKNLLFRNFYLNICIVTMFFGGGMIPTYILYKDLGLLNNFLVYIIPGFYSVGNMIIFKSFFISLPSALEEAATIDGYNHLQIFFKIVLPISAPVIATITLFTAVGHWNSWFDAYIYMSDEGLYPLQTLLKKMLAQSQMITDLQKSGAANMGGITSEASGTVTSNGLQLAMMMITTGPIIIAYPFLQKYFVKGMTIGAVKE